MKNSKHENRPSLNPTAQLPNRATDRPIQILLIEDDPVYAELLQDLLIDENTKPYQLKVTTLLREGMDYLKQQPFDVVLTDLSLPDSRGLDTVTQLLKATELPVIVLTNMDDSNLALEAMRQGAQDYLLKGELSYRLLEKSIHYAIERSRTQAQFQQRTQELLRFQDTLRQRETEFRALLENSPDIISRFDRQYCYVYINPIIERITGLSPQRFIGKTNQDLGMPKDKVGRWNQTLNQVFETGQEAIIEFDFLSRDGIRYFQGRLVPEWNVLGEVETVLGIARDITNLKQVELDLQHLNQELEIRVQQRTEALLQSEARLQKLAAYVPGMLYQYILRIDGTDAMLYGSPACKTIFEVEPEAVIQNSNLLWSMVHADDLQMLQDSIADSAKNLQRWHVEYRIITPSGQLKWLEATSQPEKQANGDMVWYGVLNEISDRKQSEAALRESEEKFRQLAETIREVFWIKEGDDQLLYVSPNYELIWGRSVQSLYQNHQEWCDSIHPDECDRVIAANAQKIENGFDQEYRIIRPDGEIRWIRDRAFPIFDAQGQVYRIAGIAEDISDRKQTEQALQKSQYFIQRVADTTPHLLYIYDLIEQRNIYVNPYVTTVLGYQVQDIQQMDSPLWLNLMHPDDHSELCDPLKQFDTAKDGDIIEREYRLRRADGEYRWLYSRDTVFSRTADGKPKQVLGTAQDITERKLAEAQLKASLQEKELLLKEVHHRVKNNLQIISSLFSLQSQYIDNPEVLSLLMESKNRIRAMALIHEKLYQSWTFAKIDFTSYIQTLTRNLFASYNISSNRISLGLEVSDVSLTLDDAIPCGLLINELVSNALKHAFPNQQSGEISLQLSLNSDENCVLTVKDNGVGLPQDFSLEQTNSLGMLLVKALSLQLRGHLEIQNNNGAVFKVTFPQPNDCNHF